MRLRTPRLRCRAERGLAKYVVEVCVPKRMSGVQICRQLSEVQSGQVGLDPGTRGASGPPCRPPVGRERADLRESRT